MAEIIRFKQWGRQTVETMGLHHGFQLNKDNFHFSAVYTVLIIFKALKLSSILHVIIDTYTADKSQCFLSVQFNHCLNFLSKLNNNAVYLKEIVC